MFETPYVFYPRFEPALEGVVMESYANSFAAPGLF